MIRSICGLEQSWAPFPKTLNNEIKVDFPSEVRKALVDVGVISRIVADKQLVYVPEKGIKKFFSLSLSVIFCIGL